MELFSYEDEWIKVRCKESETLDHCLIVHLNGNLNHGNLVPFIRGLETVRSEFGNLIFDFRRYRESGETTYSSLFGFVAEVRKHGGEVVFCEVPQQTQEIFDLLGASRTLAITKTLQDAIASLKNRGTTARGGI